MTWGLDEATVRFGAVAALESVTLSAQPSTLSVVVGGDGAGKSTALAALVGLVPLEGGSVRRPTKRHIGYVPATAGLYVDLTVEQNLEFVGRAYGLERSDLAARSSALLERTGLGDARRRLGAQLSGGMQRKLAVAMALLHEPGLLVLDEPTTGVDPVSRAELWRLITGAVAGGAAVVVATAYVNEALRAPTVVLLEQGRVIASGSPDEIIASVPGVIGRSLTSKKPAGEAWRWGSTWRVWSTTGNLDDQVVAEPTTFEDAVIVASLRDEQREST